MKTRPLTIQIPKPDENGFCNDKCPIKEDFDDCLYSQKKHMAARPRLPVI